MVRTAEIFQRQKSFFATGKTLDIAFRVESLQKLGQALRDHRATLERALQADLHKAPFEAYATEIGFVLHEIRHAIGRVHKWSKPRKVRTPLFQVGSASWVYPEPYGTVLVISPWNYPLQLSLAPLVGAIAAGNCAVIKPSELSPNTAAALAEMIASTFPPEYVAVLEGGIETSQELLEQPFDYIFFTGSTAVGRIVMEAAARNLTPVTLELGGKSPCIVHSDANLELAARRIAWGKFLNAGQTCVAPDYLWVHSAIADQFINLLRDAITTLYGAEPLLNPNYPKIVNERHFKRLSGYLQSGRIVAGGAADERSLKVEPTLMEDVTWDSPVMQEEIFGPILPIVRYSDIREVVRTIQAGPKPLALYVFTENPDIERLVVHTVPFGGGCVNDTVLHLATPYLPFGGVGASGMGAYHGKHSFDTFSHAKSVLKQTTWFDLPFRYGTLKHALRWLETFLR